MTNRFAGGDLEHLGGKADGAFDEELFVLRPVDQVRRDCTSLSIWKHSYGSSNETRTLLEVLHVAGGQGDPDFVDLRARDRGTRRIVLFLSLSDVTHPDS